MNTFLKILPAVLPAAGVLLAAAWLEHLLRDLSGAQLLVLSWLPLMVFGAGLALAVRFNRGRIFFALINLALAYITLRWYWPASAETPARILFAGVAMLLPLNLTISQYLRDRGSPAIWRGTRFWILGIQVFALVLIAEARLDWPARVLTWHWPVLDNTLPGHLPLLAVVTLLLALLTSYGRLHAEPGIGRAGFCGMMLAVAILLLQGATPSATLVWLGAAGLILGIALVQESWNLAYLDPLTELPGRRALEEQLARLGDRYAIAMVDVDHFKQFNDRYGHHVGDEVLRMVAFQLREVGGGGRAFRYGGEEFCILFADREAAEAVPFLEALREQIAEARFELRQRGRRLADSTGSRKRRGRGTIGVTISIGLAQRGARLARPAAVLTAADKALYKAKQQGRNRLAR